ncbi:MAG: CapA family protein [Melioribacteraceae bacterium]|nr:MAG: CapA family protein [Melioribacteraceae bacterium]
MTIVNFSVVGDLMCHSVQYKYAKSDSGYDFSENFEIIKPFLKDADFTFGNLETVLAGEKVGYSGYPLFNSPDEYLYAIKDAGFDLLVTANNHSLDKGKKGLLRTIEQIKESGIYHTGTFSSQFERDSIIIYEAKGLRFALLAYSYGTNGMQIPKGEQYLINLIDTTLIKNDIQKAKNLFPDLVLVYFHFGDEYKTKPSLYQQDIVNKTISYGADIIIGSHPHVPQPIEFFKTNNGNLDSGFVAYSLGNFISNQRWRYSDSGPILNFSIVKNNLDKSIHLHEIKVIPTWVFKGKRNENLDYVIIPSDSVINKDLYPFMTENDWSAFKQSYYDIVEILSSISNKIKFYSPYSEFLDYLKRINIYPN